MTLLDVQQEFKPGKIPLPLAPGHADNFQTPPVALVPLVPFLQPGWKIWEPACGKGNLVRALRERGYVVTGTDINEGRDFFLMSAGFCDCIVTNPPFSRKDDFIRRCYELRKPFALLLPLTALGATGRQKLYREHGLEIIMLGQRIHFETPSGREGTTSWFETAWFTWGLGIGSALTFATLPREERPVRPTLFDNSHSAESVARL